MKSLFNALYIAVMVVLMVNGCQKGKVAEEGMILVVNVIEDSPSAKAGIKSQDVIISYNTNEVHTISEVNRLKKETSGDSVAVEILREGKLIKVQLPPGQMGVYLKEVLPEIKRKADAVIIEGIAPLDWSTGRSNSFLAALEAIAHHKGIDKNYVYLYGVSGAAFRLHFYEGWCPSSPDPTCGFNAGEAALEALGMEYHGRFIPEDDTAVREELRKEICVSINKGFPVIAIDLIEVPEWGIVTGYQNAGRDFFCRTYYDKRMGYDMAERFPWACYFIDGIEDAPGDVENYKRSFEIALENLTTDRYDEYVSGIAAFEEWIESLQSDDFTKMTDEEFFDASHAHAWIYDRLIHDREMGVQYLLNTANYFPGLSALMRAIARIYQDEVDALKPSENLVMYSFEMKSRDDWNNQMREEAVVRLQKALALEREAVVVWKKIAAGI